MDVSLANPFCLTSDSVIRDQQGALRGQKISPARGGFDGPDSSGEEVPEEVERSDLVKGAEEVEIDLDDEPGSLLDSLNA